ncbi:MAG: 8-oxoguanine deaminase [Streptosporangiales bacterium]
MSRTIIDNAAVATMDAGRTEYASGHLVLDGSRVERVGPGPAPRERDASYVDATGCLVTPGLVNTHHHLYQWLTRGLAVDATLFEWLTTLYPVWAGLDEEAVGAAARGALGWLARTGCTTTTDHHYVFPRRGGDSGGGGVDRVGDLLAAEVDAAGQVGLRFHPCRGSMDLGKSSGGLPPDEVTEDRDRVLAATQEAIDRHHDPSPDAMLRIAVGPCSPFTVSGELMAESADLARRNGVRMHTHLAETTDEESFCRAQFGSTPAEYAERLGWLGDDVWLAHAVHLDDAAVQRVAGTGTGVAHSPSSNARLGAGIARVQELRDAGATVGLGVDGAASNEACSLLEEVRHAVLFARARGGPRALAVRDALEMATIGGARLLGRDSELGSLEPGKLADIAVWRLDTPAHADIADPVAALVLGAPPPLDLLLVHGRRIVEGDALVTLDEQHLARDVAAARRALLARAEGTR